MLEFTKTLEDVTDNGLVIKSAFAITADGSTMVTTRLIDNKAHRLISRLDGTIGMLGAKVNEMTKMPNDEFKLFSEIQFRILEEEEVI